ncbi:MAG: DEAD-box ATP-dependent helicase CshA [Labilithrix sp.]|nr:DEAD-box ATP-dependent helicase CshA [Labilithrix sp.]
MGARTAGEPVPAFDARERARAAGREGLPQSTLSEWEPPADEDDDSPLFGAGAAAALEAPRAPRAPRARTGRGAPARPMQDAESAGGLADDAVETDRHPRLPSLPGITEGPATEAPARRDGRRPTRDRGEGRPEAAAGSGAEAPREGGRERADQPREARGPREPRETREAREPREPREGDRASSEPRQPDGRDDASLANIFVNVGRRDGASPESLQDILATGGVPHEETGNIRVRDRITFVTVKKELVDQAIQALAGQVVGGRTVVAEPARDSR